MGKFRIYPPTGGISRVMGKQSQPPYTCVASRNFWPVDTRTGENLTATRPPQETVSGAPTGPINLFQQINVPSPTAFLAANGILYKRDNSDGSWDAITSTVGVSTGRAVFAAPYFRQLLIANNGTPLWYDNDLGTLVALTATAGFVPTDCRLTATFQGSVWLGGSPTDDLGPHVFTAHRFGEIQDWDFAADDELAAYISTGEDRGLITEPLSNMTAITSDQMVLGCEEQIWLMSGHPRRGGRFDRLSNQTGVLGQNAIASTPKGFFFLSHDGLMFVARNDYSNLVVTPVSKNKIPSDLLDISFDILNPTVCLSYSSRWNAVYITVRDTVKPQSWLYYLDTGGFYEQPIDEYPLVMFPFESLVDSDACGVLFGGQSLKRFNRTATETITSSQIIGPVKISADGLDVNVIRNVFMPFAPGATDDAAVVKLYTGPTGAVAVARAEADDIVYRANTTVAELRANTGNWWVNLRGCYVALKIEQTESTNRVVFEGLVGKTEPGGTNVDAGLVPPVITAPTALPLEVDDN